MRKPNLLKLMLPLGLLLIISSLLLGHFTHVPNPYVGFSKGMGITLIVAYVLRASMSKTLWFKLF